MPERARRLVAFVFGPRTVRRPAALVAVVVTALVGVVLTGTLAIVDLSALPAARADDTRLRAALRLLERDPAGLDAQLHRPAGGSPFEGALVVWRIDTAGEATASYSTAPDLPSAYRTLVEPADAVLDGHHYRLVGEPYSGGWLVVGVGTEALGRYFGGVVLPQLALVPPALAGVFVVSLLIGRWAAQPVERARLQQLAFTANASHELRTPLTVVEGEVSLALVRSRTADEYRATLERMARETRHLRVLVDDLLWLARFESGPPSPEPERVDLVEAGHRAVERFARVAQARELTLRLTATSSDAAVVAPAEWIDRLLGVLLDNACRYTPRGGEVAVSVVGSPSLAELLVDDSGPGIPGEERERVFQRFHRASSTSDGAGLGLAIGAAVVTATRGEWVVGRSPLGGARVGVAWRRQR